MSRERFEWLESVAGEIIKTPGSESNVKEIFDKCKELAASGDQLVDTATGTVWDPVRGRALEGELAGEVLDTLPAFTSFPDDFDTFWPDGRHWR